MKPVSMKLTKDEMKVNGVPVSASESKGPAYPWGLEVRLDSAALDKLGIKDLPKVGADCKLVGICEVTEVSEREGHGGKQRNVTIQIQKLAIEHGEDAFDRGFKKGPKKY